MSKLFIIGNGFDVGHGLKTKYSDFHDFLQKNYPDVDEEEYAYPDVFQDKDGEMNCEDSVAVAVLMRLINASDQSNGSWSSLEEEMGRLDYSELFDEDFNIIDEDGDVDLYKTAYQNEDIASDIKVIMQKFSDYFTGWIESINYDDVKIKDKFAKLIKQDDIFLNFNYTKTLESIYDIKDIWHLHGCVGKEIIFGHGDNCDVSDYYMRHNIGAENIMSEIHELLRKDTDKVIYNNTALWNRIQKLNITDIYSYGFSFGKVDLVYIQKICQLMDTKRMIWHLHNYDEKNYQRYKKCLQKSGFEGKLEMFSTE